MSNIPVAVGLTTSPIVNNTTNVGALTTTAILGTASAAVDAPTDIVKLSSSVPVLVNENVEKKSTETVLVSSPISSTFAQQQQAVVPTTTSPDIPIPTTSPATTAPNNNHSSVTINPNTEKLLLELKQKKEMVRRMDADLDDLRRFNHDLFERERKLQDHMIMRQKGQKQLLDNYSDHIRARRATQDDPLSIQEKLRKLKKMIKTLSCDLASRCEAETATNAVVGFWVNLHEAIQKMGKPLPVERIRMLTEKFLMDVLVQNMNYNSFTGLRISEPYTQLQMWFDRYEPTFCTRLRQEIAKVVVSDNAPSSVIHQEIQKLNKRIYNSLYSSLLKAYPFIKQENENVNTEYSVKLREMVDSASDIGYAMRGQEVEIAAAAVGEGSEAFDPKTMIDEDGKTAGIVTLCINPPFIAYSSRVEVLEKARVLCCASATKS